MAGSTSSRGSDLLRLTTSRATDGHAVWTADGRIMWNSGIYGFRDEAALYDNTFQQYGQIFIMNADGSGKRMLTDSVGKIRCHSTYRPGFSDHRLSD